MKKSLLLILTVVFLSFINSTYAQRVFIDGYIVRNDGSIIQGQIEYVKKDNTPSECIFKWFELAKPLVYKPGDIKAFGYKDGNRYDSKKIRNRKVFISCLASGKAGLFYDGKTLYIETKQTDDPAPLTKGATGILLSGNQVRTSDYRDLLMKVLGDKKEVTIPATLKLDEKSILDFIAEYNKSAGNKSSVYTETNQKLYFNEMSNAGRFKFSYGVFAGVTGIKYEAKDLESYPNLFIPKMTSFSYIPLGGIFVERQVSRVKDIIDIHAELSFAKQNLYVYNYESQASFPYLDIRSDIFMNSLAFKAPLYLKINLSQTRFSPHILMGGFFTYITQASYSRNYETEDKNNLIRQYTDNSLSIKSYEYGWLAGIGLKYTFNPKRVIFMQCRYESGSGVYSTPDMLKQSSSYITILGGMKF